ncbi:hypothetical protein [Polycladidibacter hongkongensis]|uniref:hypothetical protein n=1 Tax=Polycladidibacter hongkongensis TaxID=1647556 RepID=UPI0008340028|nr:hypothetical protein [Pseudovibrio hongkongensis]
MPLHAFTGKAAMFLKRQTLNLIPAILLASLAMPKAASAVEDLAEQATNPVAALVQFQLQDNFSPATWGAEGWSNSFVVQPVIPVDLGVENYFQTSITRPTIPFTSTAETAGVNFDKRKTVLGTPTYLPA